MAKILFYGARFKAQADEGGKVKTRQKIPGVFSGIDPTASLTPDGRYIKRIQVWTDSGSPGDAITNVRVEDTDGLLSQMAGMFPKYPIIQEMTDQQVEPPALPGLAIPNTAMVTLEPIDPIDSRGMQFIPSGLYLCWDFESGSNSTETIINVNYIWGKYFETAK